MELYFPQGQIDAFGEQIDLRPMNSWRQKLGEISTEEFLEAFLVGAVAPFHLTSRLLPAMRRSPHARRFVVSVSAREGQFAWRNKTPHHPHTNMTKAALNMLTRTASMDLAREGIYFTCVDTGWITHELPYPEAQRCREEYGFHVPLDMIDGAARVYDPIVRGLTEPGEPLHGHFLKDYAIAPW
jgi:NAD(P)-dependent dehydrogenase (short-subunit alcohol dehydrogenase family)